MEKAMWILILYLGIAALYLSFYLKMCKHFDFEPPYFHYITYSILWPLALVMDALSFASSSAKRLSKKDPVSYEVSDVELQGPQRLDLPGYGWGCVLPPGYIHITRHELFNVMDLKEGTTIEFIENFVRQGPDLWVSHIGVLAIIYQGSDQVLCFESQKYGILPGDRLVTLVNNGLLIKKIEPQKKPSSIRRDPVVPPNHQKKDSSIQDKDILLPQRKPYEQPKFRARLLMYAPKGEAPKGWRKLDSIKEIYEGQELLVKQSNTDFDDLDLFAPYTANSFVTIAGSFSVELHSKEKDKEGDPLNRKVFWEQACNLERLYARTDDAYIAPGREKE